MNIFASFLIGLTTFFGGIFHHTQQYDGPNPSQTVNFGTTGFPAALDTTSQLPNPGATDSVATVSHSALHTNENLAIIATETKVGTGASTPTNNTIFVGNGTGSSGYSSSATSTNFLATNFLTASSTIGSTSINTLLATRATSTDLYVGNTSSSTNLYANLANFGNSTINKLTVTSCTGCGSAGVIPILYIATSSNGRFFDKRLTLASGDVVTWGCVSQQESDSGVLSYRITSPWNTTTTTPISANSSPSYAFSATTTETVEFACQDSTGTASAGWTQYWAGVGFNNAY